MSSPRVQQLAAFTASAANSTTVCSSHCVGNNGIRDNFELEAGSFTWPKPFKSLTSYVSAESQDHNSALPNLPSRQSNSLARYVSDETQHNKSPEKEQNDLTRTPRNNTCTETIPQVLGIPQENQHPSTENIVGCVISSDRIDMFINEAKNIQSQDKTFIDPPHCIEPGNQELISFVTLFEQQMETSSNNLSEPVPFQDYSCVTTKAPIETYVAERTVIVGDGVPDSTASSALTSYKSKSSNIPLPIRPLNAYNYFFADERERIISGKDNDVYDDDKKQRLLLQHLMKDRSARRKHRKTHGKISFTTLTRMISQRWKNLPGNKKEFYKDISAADFARYRQEMSQRIEQPKVFA